MDDLLLPAYQKLYAALQSLERFSKGQDLFANIACIDSFLSEFRNITFVLQKSLAHTEYISEYKTLGDKYLKNEDCSWLVEKRNQVTKEEPFRLEKLLNITLYLPNGAGVFPTAPYTIEDEEDYSSIIEMVKRVIEGIPSIEVFFSVEFIYREIGSERNLFSTIDHGIDAIMALLEELNKTIGGEISKTRELVLKKIKGLHFHQLPKDYWFIDDYVFYRQDHVFEKGTRCEIVMPYNPESSYKNLCNMVGIKNEGNYIEETFRAFELMHIATFSMQKELMPTILTLKEDGTLSIVSYDASIKTTTYRKINEMARRIIEEKIVEVCVALIYCVVPIKENLPMISKERYTLATSEILVCASVDSNLNEKEYTFESERINHDDYLSNVMLNNCLDHLENSRKNLKPICDAFIENKRNQ